MRMLLATLISLISLNVFAGNNNLEISIGAQKEVHRYSYNFFDTRPNQVSYLDLIISNKGDEEATLEDMYIQGAYFYASSNCPDVMPANSKCNVTVRYWPSFTGYHVGRFGIDFVGGDKIIVDLSGWCKDGF